MAEDLTAHWEPSPAQAALLKEFLRPSAQSPHEVLVERITILERRLDAIAPAPGPAPDMMSEFVRPKAVQWPFSWHGRPDQRPNSLPRAATLNKLEAITRARWGYDPEGRLVKSGQPYDQAWKTVDAIRAAFAHGAVASRAAIYQGTLARFEGVDLEFACFGTLLGLWADSFEKDLDGQKTPADFKGQTIEGYLLQFQNAPAVEEP